LASTARVADSAMLPIRAEIRGRGEVGDGNAVCWLTIPSCHRGSRARAALIHGQDSGQNLGRRSRSRSPSAEPLTRAAGSTWGPSGAYTRDRVVANCHADACRGDGVQVTG
jgi:hypothetical protein